MCGESSVVHLIAKTFDNWRCSTVDAETCKYWPCPKTDELKTTVKVLLASHKVGHKISTLVKLLVQKTYLNSLCSASNRLISFSVKSLHLFFLIGTLKLIVLIKRN